MVRAEAGTVAERAGKRRKRWESVIEWREQSLALQHQGNTRCPRFEVRESFGATFCA